MNTELKKIATALKRLEKAEVDKAFDAYHISTRPTKKQTEILGDIGKIQYRYVVAGNQSGKSQIAARDLSWFLNGTHPYFKRPAHWGAEPLLVLIAGQDLTMMSTELWYKKVKPFLHDEWKEEKSGTSLKKCINQRTGDQIVFLSHSDGSEKNRRHMQSYVAHYVWLDEMPTSHKILEELQRRVDSRKGRFLATFTPKFKNDRIRKVVDASRAPVSKKYRMSKLDNPIYADRLEEEIQKLDGYSEAEKRTILYGDWSTGESAVYAFDNDKMTVDDLPPGYNRGWRHVESVDPALKSKCGYTLWAEDPNDGVWYLVSDEYLVGSTTLDPESLFFAIQDRSRGYNIVRRISDNMAWYTSVATKHRITYMTPYSKNSRKEELIKGLQIKLSQGKVKIGSWCTTFIDEIQSCQWAENADRIINASSFHTLDCSQYFCDAIPKYEEEFANKEWHVRLREQNEKRKRQDYEQAKLAGKAKSKARVGRPITGWGKRGARAGNWGRRR